MSRHSLGLLLCLIILGCSDPHEKTGRPDTEAYPLNEAMVYSTDFAEIFHLDKSGAVELDPGLMAVRLYWTRLANPLFGDAGEPALMAQFYIKEDVPIHLSGQEGTHHPHEAVVRSGFLYFAHRPPDRGTQLYEREIQTFLNRAIAVSESIGTKTHRIHRYKRPLVPGVQVIEIGAVFREPFYIYFYTGEETPATQTLDPLFSRISQDIDDYDREQLIRFKLPDEIHSLLQKPFVAESPLF